MMASKLARLIKIQPDFTGDMHDVWIESLIDGYHTTCIHMIIVAIVRPDKQYRPLLRVWAPDTSDIQHELSMYHLHQGYDHLEELEGGK
jgi:hypothetical protein